MTKKQKYKIGDILVKRIFKTVTGVKLYSHDIGFGYSFDHATLEETESTLDEQEWEKFSPTLEDIRKLPKPNEGEKVTKGG